MVGYAQRTHRALLSILAYPRLQVAEPLFADCLTPAHISYKYGSRYKDDLAIFAKVTWLSHVPAFVERIA